MGLIKYLLFIFNFIFALCGLAILIVGVVVHLKLTNVAETVDGSIVFPSITLIAIGSIIFVIAFFGCCGAIRESHCMTITFASFLLTILIIQVAVAVYAFLVLKNSDANANDVRKQYTEIFDSYWQPQAGPREIVDIIQGSLECCGIDGPDDYRKINHNGTIPWSCCGKEEGGFCTSADKIYGQGCLSQIQQFLVYAGKALGGIALGIAGVELIGIIFALCLANSIKNSQRRGYRV